MFILEKPIDT